MRLSKTTQKQMSNCVHDVSFCCQTHGMDGPGRNIEDIHRGCHQCKMIANIKGDNLQRPIKHITTYFHSS
jgi:hypothetical protein